MIYMILKYLYKCNMINYKMIMLSWGIYTYMNKHIFYLLDENIRKIVMFWEIEMNYRWNINDDWYVVWEPSLCVERS